MKKILILLLLIGCGPQWAKDPNAHVLVTSQYEDGPERIISNPDCNPQIDCTGKSDAQCAIALYEESGEFMEKGKAHASRELYLSASSEYMHAMCRLVEAEIRLRRAKLDNFEDYKTVMDFNLEEKVKARIKLCESNIRHYQWKR